MYYNYQMCKLIYRIQLSYIRQNYEIAYKPTALRNWEVPKVYKNNPRAQTRHGKTSVVANDRGHILPGFPKSDDNPWGKYVGTWHLPRRINRETADELNGLNLLKKYPCKQRIALEKEAEQKLLEAEARRLEALAEAEERKALAEAGPVPQPEVQEPTPQDTAEEKTESLAEAKAESEEDVRKKSNEDNIAENLYKARPYVPGDFTEEKYRPDSYDDLAKKRFEPKTRPQRKSSEGYPKYREDFSRKDPPPEKDLTEETEKFYKLHEEMMKAQYKKPTRKQIKNDKGRLPTPILDAISNFSTAKQLHRINLEHEPLPDTITDAMYRKLQMQRCQSDPGLALKNGNFATGVGWKGYPGFGPTRCTKLKVYRPKTCVHDKVIEKDERPSSVSSFDKKWRFIRQNKVTPIELAICWDLTPENKLDEPKPPTHIDGSNGSLAPAVFSLVHSPKENAPKEDSDSSRKSSIAEQKCDGVHGCGPLFEHKSNQDQPPKNYFFHRAKTAKPSREPSHSSHSSEKSSEHLVEKKRAKSAYNLNKIETDNENDHNNNDNNNKNNNVNNLNSNNHENHSHCSNEAQKTFYHSTPDLRECNHCYKKRIAHDKITKLPKARLCMACELRNLGIKENKPKNEFKMAFKAGVPQKKQFVSSNYYDRMKIVNVPVQIEPYRYRNYTINSLAPPFCLQKNSCQDYPDHWRLATVYQQSYKPLQLRKKPMISTIFK